MLPHTITVSARGLLVAALVGVAASANAAEPAGHDLVQLTSGETIRCDVYSDVPADGVRVRLRDGSTHFYPRASVRRVQYDADITDPTPAAPPPPVSAPTPVPAAPVPEPAPATTPAPAPAASSSIAFPGPAAPVEVRSESIRPVWMTGLITEAGVWALRAVITSAVCASAGGCDGVDAASTVIPVAGAYVEFAHATPGYRAPLALSAAVETAALATFIVGLAVHRRVPASVGVAAARSTAAGTGAFVAIAGTF
jgi:hypothetical protein